MKKATPTAGSIVATIATLTMATSSLVACGGSGDGLNGEQQALADSIANYNFLTGDMFDKTQAQCYGDALVRDFGVDRLAELGVTVETPEGVGSFGSDDLNDAEVTSIVGALDDCLDVRATLIEVFTPMAGADGASCIIDTYTDDEIRSLLKSMMLDDGDGADQAKRLGEARLVCGIG